MTIIKADDVAMAVCKAQGIDYTKVYRVIVDLCVRDAAKIYIEMYGSERILSVDWHGLTGAEVTILDKPDSGEEMDAHAQPG